jgi:hypothetical protein
MWQGALRNPDDPARARIVESIEAGEQFTVELLYSDHVGRQRTISRFLLVPVNETWLASLNRHWYLDWDGPRPENLTVAAGQVVYHDYQVAAARRAAMERQEAPGGSGGRADADEQIRPTGP